MIKKGTKHIQLPLVETHSRPSMIKGNTLRQSHPIKVGIKALPVSKDVESHGSTVEPIVENGLVVGVIHYCHCGEKTEIRFELEKSTREEIIES